MALSLTRSVSFTARHRLFDERLTPTENRTRFGETVDDHSHAYRVSVTLSGEPDPVTGILLDLGKLDRLLTDRVVQRLDGAHLNEAVPVFASGGKLPTCEALAAWLFDDLTSSLPPTLRLERVRVAEDEALHADCTRTS